MIGFNFGGNFALFPAATADYFGNKNVGTNYPWVFMSYGVGGVVGPILGGVMGDAKAWMWAFVPAGDRVSRRRGDRVDAETAASAEVVALERVFSGARADDDVSATEGFSHEGRQACLTALIFSSLRCPALRRRPPFCRRPWHRRCPPLPSPARNRAPRS